MDYQRIAKAYNETPVGHSVVIPRVKNVTLFKAALYRRGLTDDDFEAGNRRRECWITRLTEKPAADI